MRLGRLQLILLWSCYFLLDVAVQATDDDIRSNCVPGEHQADNLFPGPDPRAPDRFTVTWTTTVSDVPLVLEVVREWSPVGVDRFYQLVNDNFYNCATFFRVVPGFVAQFGLAAEPEETAKWDNTIVDDPGVQSNLMGYITFATAGPDTRTSQLFISLSDNTNLDAQGFSAFGRVTSGYIDWAHNIRNPTPNSSGGIDQTQIENKGNEWILQNHPRIDMIVSTTVTIPGEEDPGQADEAPRSAGLLNINNRAPTQIALLASFILIECVLGFFIWCRR